MASANLVEKAGSQPSSPPTETTRLLQTSSQGSALDALEPHKNPYLLESLDYTPEEEYEVLRILDRRLMPCILLTTFVLNMDRTNNSNAISDNLPFDLGFDIDVVNTATALHSVFFAIACLSGAVLSKIAGPSRCESATLPLIAWVLTLAALRDTHSYVLMGCRNLSSCPNI